ncbi:MAG: hypothetical protein EB059_04400 [Alphaproteobacteria bacterium]|nr:hypothetical protein [Alphaproteobacteria bacterium]
MDARRQHIEDLVRNLLPYVEEYGRRQRAATIIINASVLCYIMLGAFLIYNYIRPINTNEYTILNSVIALSAQEAHATPLKITNDLLTQFHINQLQDLKSHQWNEALKFLAIQKPLVTTAL